MFDVLISNYGSSAVIYFFGLLVFLAFAGFTFALFGMKEIKGGVKRISAAALGGGIVDESGNRRKEIQAQLKKQEEALKKSTEGSLAILTERAEMKGGPKKLYFIAAIIGFAIVALLTTQGVPIYLAIFVVPVLLLLLPKKIVRSKIKKREKKYLETLPDAIDVLVRGVRTGLPVNEGMRLVGKEMPEPVGPEFMRITDATAVGVTLEDALERSYTRMPLPEVNFFKIVLNIQKQTGGNLSEALGNLSNTLRERKKLKNKILALSSEAKASAMIIGSMPFLLGCLLYVISPDYISVLFTTFYGKILVGAGLFWMGIGVFVMKTMIDIEI